MSGGAGMTIDPERLYDTLETAEFLGFRGKLPTLRNNMYAIPDAELAVYRMGPNGGIKRYLGRDILEYRESRRLSA